jgi:hypothetical protein
MGTDIGIGELHGVQWIPMGRWGVVAGLRMAFEKVDLDERGVVVSGWRWQL